MTKYTVSLTINGSTSATATVTDLDDLYNLLSATKESDLIEIDDMTSLPTFGGNEPDDTMGIWSWDASRLIVGGDGTFKIVDRD